MNTNVLLNQRRIDEPVGPDSVVFEWEWESKKYNISTWWWTGITPIIIRMEYHVFKLPVRDAWRVGKSAVGLILKVEQKMCPSLWLSMRTAWSVGKSAVWLILKVEQKTRVLLYDFEFSFIGFYYIWNFIKT